MEVVLLWLDELDDLLFCAALRFESLRRQALQLGLLAAVMVAACELLSVATFWIPFLNLLAVASVSTWLGSLLARHYYYRGPRSRAPAT